MKWPWKYISVSLLLGCVFGSLAGLFAGRAFAHRWMKKSPDIVIRRLDRKLSLTSAQHQQILAILNAQRDKARSSHEEIRRATRAQIRRVLSAEQQGRFDAMVVRHEQLRKKRGDR